MNTSTVASRSTRSLSRAYRFTRVIRYDDVRVEDGRELHWVWEGRATGTRANVAIEVSLARRGFA